MFYHCFRAATDICWAVKMISSLLNIEIRVHVIDNGNNEIRGGGVERDAGRDEKQLIKFAWPYICFSKSSIVTPFLNFYCLRNWLPLYYGEN